MMMKMMTSMRTIGKNGGDEDDDVRTSDVDSNTAKTNDYNRD